MVTHLKTLRMNKGKGKPSERMQQAVEELEYLVTFNWSVSQAMQHTMQDLSEGIFISMAILTLARRDRYLEHLLGGVKPCVLHRSCLLHCSQTGCWLKLKMRFPIVRRGIFLATHIGSPFAFILMLPQLQNQHTNWTGSPLYLLGSRSGISNRERKDRASSQLSNRNRLRVPSRVNFNYCVQSVAKLKDAVNVSGKLESLNPSPVKAGRKDLTSKSKTVNSHVNSRVVNSVTRWPQRHNSPLLSELHK